MADCPKCRGEMTPGFVIVPDSGSGVKWVDGEFSFWTLFGFGSKVTDLTSRRCSVCGFVEFFADAKAKPVRTLTSVEDQTQRLNQLVTKLQDRIAVLERIATDPAERTAREIESLRGLPSIEDDEQRT